MGKALEHEHVADVRRAAEHKEWSGRKLDVFTPSVGDQIDLAMALACGRVPGMVCGGLEPCATDYLAAAGAKFPESVTVEEMEAFNHETLKPDMDEADEHARYAAISRFFRRLA